MWRYIGKRFLYMLFTIWVVTVISFVVIQLPPGDFVSNLVSQMVKSGASNLPPDFESKMREMYGRNEPMYVQYAKWLGNIVTKGQFGYSFLYQRDASELIVERLPMTFMLSLFTLLFVWAAAIQIGIYSAVRQYSPGDYLFTFSDYSALTR